MVSATFPLFSSSSRM